MSDFITVAKVGDIPEGQGRMFAAGERIVAVFLHEGKYYAMDDYCPHMGAPLWTGEVTEGLVICDRHRWAFRLADGTSPDSATLRAETFPVRVEGDEIQVCVPQMDSDKQDG